mmetsp:Transcript_19736/g.50114  ORF Transcript_19736/g.50114 Transcript_19736/m.50114 type:complete len:202 (-) Transcript_19736:214-819(-)
MPARPSRGLRPSSPPTLPLGADLRGSLPGAEQGVPAPPRVHSSSCARGVCCSASVRQPLARCSPPRSKVQRCPIAPCHLRWVRVGARRGRWRGCGRGVRCVPRPIAARHSRATPDSCRHPLPASPLPRVAVGRVQPPPAPGATGAPSQAQRLSPPPPTTPPIPPNPPPAPLQIRPRAPRCRGRSGRDSANQTGVRLASSIP